jgi:phage shock protein PspC (stress-responsive transcriptional regulator)
METTQTYSRRFYRSTTDKFMGGVCGGIAEYYAIDPSIVRVLTVLLTLCTGVAAILYVAAWIVVPERPDGEVSPATGNRAGWNSYLPGVLLVFVGAVLLLIQVFKWLHWHFIWPILMILVGLGLVFYNTGRSKKNDYVNQTGRNGL